MPRFRDHHLHLPHIHIESDNNKNLKYLYGVRVARDLVNKLAFFFLPIYLFEFGQKSGFYDFTGLPEFTRGILSLAIYYILVGTIGAVIVIPAAKIIGKVGYQKTMISSYIFRLIALLFMFMSSQVAWVLFIAVIFDSLQSVLFWPSYYTVLSQNTLKNHMGQDLGILQFLLQLIAVVSPAISGYIALISGLESLFLVALVGNLIGFILVLQMSLPYKKDEVSFTEFFAWLREKQFRKLVVSFAGRYINDAALYVWPLYVFIFLGSVDKVGYLYTASLFIAMLFTFFVSIYIDHNKSRKPFFMSGGVLAFLWIIRTQFLSILGIALIDVVDRLTSNFHWLFFDMVMMKRGMGSNALSYFAYREVILHMTTVFFWSIFALLFIVGLGWNELFIFASVGVLLSILMKDKESLNA